MTGSSLWSPEVERAGREEPKVTSRPKFSWVPGFLFLFFIIIIIFLFVVNFVIHWNETAMGLHVFPIPIPPPTSLSTRSP